MPVTANYWIDGGEADEEASSQQQSIIWHVNQLPMNQHTIGVTYEPAYHWSYPWTSTPWSYTDLGDPVGCMEYGQHTIIGEKLIFEVILII